MASLGNLAVKTGGGVYFKVAPIAVIKDSVKDYPTTNYPTNGTLSGVVSIGGTPTPGILVRLYYRQSGQLIEAAISGAGGTYSFSGLNPNDPGAYYIVFFDPNTAAPYNFTVTKDHLTAG